MANNNNALTFGVGFDWSQAFDQKKAQEALDRAQRIVTSKPLSISVQYNKGSLKEFESSYVGSIDKIKQRIYELNAAWSKMDFKEKFGASGNLINRLKTVDIGTDENPHPVKINPAKAEAEMAQLTATLKTYGKTLTEVIHDHERALEEENRLTQKYYEDELRQLAKVVNARIDAYNKEQQIYQQRRQMLEQTFFSGSKGYSAISSYSDLPKDVEVAVNKQIGLYNRLDSEIQKLTAQYEKYKALQAEAGGKGYEDDINKILKEREALMKQQAAIATTADEANARRVKQEEAARKQVELQEQHNEKILALQERIKEVQSRAIPSEATTQVERTNRAYQEQQTALDRIKTAITDVETKMATAKANGEQEKYNQLMREREALYTKQISAEEDLRQKLIAKNDAKKAYDNAKEEERKRLIELQTKAYDAQAKKIDDINKKIQAQRDARDAMQTPSKSLADIVKAYDDQKNVVDKLKISLLSATATREYFDSKHAKGTEYTKAHINAQERERELTQQLADEESKLTACLERKLAAEKANAQQIEKDDALIRRQLASVDALAKKIQEYQSAQLKVGTFNTEVERLTTAYVKQSNSIKTLRTEYEDAVKARKAFSDADKKNPDGTANKAYIESLQKEEQLAKQLNQAEQQLLSTEERRFQILKQIGLSGNIEQINWGQHDPIAIDLQIQKYHQLKKLINDLGVEYERLKAIHNEAGTDITKDVNANKILKERIAARKQLDQITRTADQAETEALRKHEALVASIQAKVRKRNEAQKQRAAKLREEQKALQLQENTINNIQRKIAAMQSVRARTDFLADPDKLRQLNSEIDRLEKLIDKVSEKGEKARKKADTGLNYQKGVIDRLIARMAVYASLGATLNFIKNVRETTAEFERQRVALGAIINDQVRGNALFSEIKAYALKSPLKIMDLTRYTKQVAAYRIETDKLFDTTKRLADVSVGLGVDMQRLVLAYGQVKAATYLRASELRQFTEAGIPMLELLSEKFTEVEGRMVSTADVMKRISKRGVEFKEVEQVFKDMTDAGGMFYNMQEKMGNTLYGMWAKLGDAASIMYDEIGNTGVVNDALKFTIKMMTLMMRNWKDVGRYALEAGVALTAYKLYTMAAAVANKYYATSLKLTAIEQRKLYLDTINHTKASRAFAAAMQFCGFSLSTTAKATVVLNRALHLMKSALIQTGIGALIIALGYLADKLFFAKSAAEELKEALAEIDTESGTEQMKSVRNFERLANAAVKASKEGKNYNDILDELHRTYKDIIPLEKMTIENLTAMNGNYQSLTNSIKDYVAERMKQKKIDAIIDKTGKEILDAEQEFKNKMEDVWSTEQLEAFMKEYERLIRENPTEKYFKLVEKAAKNIGAAYVDVYGNKNLAGFPVALAKLGEYKDALVEQVDWINAVESAWTKGYEALGDYGKGFEELINKTNETAINSVGGIAVSSTDYLYQQQRKNMQIYEAIAPQLVEILKDAGVAWQEGWGYLIKEVDNSVPEMISAINFDLIEQYLKDNISKIPNEQYQAIQALRKIYDDLAPTDKQTRTIRERFMEIVQAVTGGMDKMSQYNRFLKTNGQDVKDYVKFLDEQINELDNQIKALEDTASIGAKVSLFARNIFASITGGEVLTAEELKEQIEVLRKARADFSSYEKESNKSGGKSREQIGKERLQEWNEYSSVIEKIYNKYGELQKTMSKDEALKHINRYYSDSLELLKKQGLKLETFPKTAKEYQDVLRQVRDQLQKTINEYNLSAEWAAKKHVADIDVKIGSVDADSLREAYEKALKKLSNDIAESKSAKDFFDNIFAQTKDYDMAMELTMSVYGDTGENYQQQIIDQIRAAFGAGTDWEIDVTPAINVETGAVNYNELEKLMEAALKDEDLEKYREQMRKVIDDGIKFSAERAKQWMKDLSKARTFAQQRVDLAKYTAERIKEIETDPGLSEDAKSSLKTQYLAREAKEAAKLEYEAFKDTPMYVQMFENLENATTASLEAMNTKLVELQKNLKDLDPTQLKEIQKRMEEIQDQLAERNLNPFGWLKKAAKEMEEWQTNLQTNTKKGGKFDLGEGYENGISSIKELEAAIADFTKRQEEANQAVMNFMNGKEYQDAVELVNTLQAKYDTMTAEQRASEEGGTVEVALHEAQQALALKEADLKILEEAAEKHRLTLNFLIAQVGEYNRIRAKQKQAWKGADKIKEEVDKVSDAAYEMAEAFGASDDALALFQDIKNALTTVYDFTKNVTDAIAIMSKTTAEGVKAVEKASVILAVISAALQVATALFNLFANANARKKEQEIKKQQKLIDSLKYSYDRLSDAMDSTFGSDYIANYNERLENLQAQYNAETKKAQLEAEKGKKADEDKRQEYLDNARDAMDEIEKMQSEIAERMTGSDLGSAARDFANAWLDAYISYESTTQAIKEKFNDMIKNMIVEGAMAQIVQSVLDPFYQKIKEASLSDGRLDPQEIVDLTNEIPGYTTQITDGLQIFANQLESLGYDLHELGDTGEFTGIAREIASASEESITGLAAMINTQNYYISNVPLIYQEVMLIRQILSGENVSAITRAPMLDTTDLQNEYLSHLPAIHNNTEAIAERCERAAMACEDIADNLSRVIKPRGIQSTHVVNIS